MQGLKPSQLNAIERLYKRRFPREQIFSIEQAKELALLSRSINRQIGLLLDRNGKVELVLVGQANSIYIPELPYLPEGRLRGLRLLHTHLDPAGLSQEDLMDMFFLRLDAVNVLTVSPDGAPMQWQGGWIMPPEPPEELLGIPGLEQQNGCALAPPRPWHFVDFDFAALSRAIESCLGAGREGEIAKRAFLVSVSTEPLAIQERNLEELAELAISAGLEVGGSMIQRQARPDPGFILGKGKLMELEVQALNARAGMLIFDGELTPAQLHNLADISERQVIDRTQLILDIFAQHATTRAGRLQVELAQLAYAQPRLAGGSRAMDRLMGGIGGRGPGESKLEMDRRKSRERMARLRQELKKIRRQRCLERKKREINGVPVVALVGYTNAGKSTLLNILTSSGVKVEDRLFATLDPVTRRLRFPEEREITLADTVGFIRNLPRELMEAFRATLEELEVADLLIHVADASHPQLEQQLEAVETTLEELGLGEKPRLLALNKCDRLAPGEQEEIKVAWPNAILISGLKGDGLKKLLAGVERELFGQRAVPYSF